MENKKFKLKIKKRTLLIIDWANVWGWSKTLKWEVCPQKLFKFFDRPKIIDKRFYYGVEKGQPKSENFELEIKNIGFTPIFKEVKWIPVLLEEQSHFKKIVKDLFNVLDNVKNTNSNISNKLYELIKKINDLSETSVGNNKESFNLSSEKSLKEIFDLIEELDIDLKNLNIEIGGLQENLKLPVRRRKCDFDVEITRDALNAQDNYDTLLLFSGDGDYSALTADLIAKGKKVILVFASDHLGKEYREIKSNLFYACLIDNLRDILQK
ncbi:MAG: NYN domain-containing protein [Patescibacteria group bacterium]|nr:NYN domain-containing protein [Patescibacteria group bacterium]MDD5164055.1 NYN domain-containing protein [Patescibacteria group bacterium]MDD5534861.1 NYN domain-containing protein [Patescibacteria group bacterium]